MNQKEYMGFGSVLYLREILAELNSQNIFLVTGNKSYAASGAKACLEELLKNYTVHRFCDYSASPKCEDVERGIELFGKRQFDTVIAIGGGSAIDMAKLINFLSVYPSAFEAYDFSSSILRSSVRPLIAIPTTAGSGSEATSFAVLYIDKKKQSLDAPLVLPDFSIVDPELAVSLPKYTTAVSGMDALSQAIESYWCVNSDDESKGYAEEAIELAIGNLATAVNSPTKTARFAMSRAAHLAGMAINITKTTAPHAVSYPLTSYFGIPHGQAVGITLSSLLVFNAAVTEEDVLDARGARYVKETISQICKLLGSAGVSDAEEKINGIIRQIGLETRLSRLGLRKQTDIETIVTNGFDPDRIKNNPRLLTKEALQRILTEVL